MRTQRMLRYTPVLALLGLGLFTLPAQAAPTFCPATGHYYEVISGSRTWFQAKGDAKSPGRIWEGLTGHLATITSAGESSCIDALVSSSAWVGGYQPTGTQEPNSGWSWVTGESWGYTNWNGGEPNDAGGEDCLEIGGNAGWNDLNCNATRSAYVIEYDFEDEGQAAFIVNKIFTDNNPAEVEVTLSCNTGLPLEQSQEIIEGEHVAARWRAHALCSFLA